MPVYTGECQAGEHCNARSATSEGGTWEQQVHYSVYHAPRWQAWQQFRRSLVGQSPDEKLRLLKQWPLATRADNVRVLNYTRSLRGSWSQYPLIRTFSRELADRLSGVGK